MVFQPIISSSASSLGWLLRSRCFLALSVWLGMTLPVPTPGAEWISSTNSTWKLHKGLTEASSPDPSTWRQPDFDDAGWLDAPAPVYYTSTSTEPPFYSGGTVTGTFLDDMLNRYTCVYLRRSFVVAQAVTAGEVTVEVAADDGFIVWLNGLELARTNVPAGLLPFNGRALESLAEPYPIHRYSLGAGGSYLRDGTNVLCIQAFNWDPASGDFGVMASLSTTRDEIAPSLREVQPPAESTVAELTAVEVTFDEPVTNVTAGALSINGVPASHVASVNHLRHLFTFSQPATGVVSVGWTPAHGIRDFSGNGFVGSPWSYRLDTNRIGSPIITEFMANNDGALLDGWGEASDWIELHNPTDSSVNLAGWKLRDRETEWVFPPALLPAGGYLVVFASGRIEPPFTDPAGYLHTSFKLAAEGEALALLRPDGGLAWSYAAPGAQRAGTSYGLIQVTTNLVTFATPARLRVPTGSVPDAWRTDPLFDDSLWLAGQASAGYGPRAGGTVAYRVHPGTPGSQEYSGALGMDFVVNHTVVITELGCFDDNSDGLAWSIEVTLWQRNENGTPSNVADDSGAGVLATTMFSPASPGVLVGGSRFKPLAAPLTLRTGAYTIVASGYGAGERAGNLGNSAPPDPWETQSGSGALSFVGAGRPGPAGSFPTVIDGGPANRYAAGTFKFAGPDDPLPLTPLAMQNINASAFLRVRFSVPNPGAYEALALTLACDDGCVVWLNGTEIARRRAPSSPDFQAAATETGNSVETLPLSGRLLVNGENLLAIHGLNVSAGDDDFFIGATLAATDSQAGTPRYFPAPTPGRPNPSTGVGGYVADTVFSAKRGFHDTPFDLVITNATPGAVIRYTLDGSAPSESHGSTYTAPLPVGSTTVVRAFATKPGFQPSNVDTHSYLFAHDVAVQPAGPPPGYPASWTDYSNGGTYPADYGMIDPATRPQDYLRAAGTPMLALPEARAALSNSVKALPVLSIVTDRAHLFDPATGIYLHPNARGEAWERPISVEFISTNAVDNWHARAGLHIMGLTSRRLDVTPKLNLMLVFNADYGAPWLTEPFFGTDGPRRIKRIALRTNTRESWLYEENGFGTGTYIVDGFVKDAARDSGEPATRHRYCHVFLNGLYWGVYNPTERPESHWAETTFGGEDEDYDVINLCCPNRIDAGTLAPWQQLLSTARAGLTSTSAYQAIQGNHPDGTPNPALRPLLNVDSLIGFMLNGYFHASLDWPDNFFAIHDHVGNRTAGWRFVTWDTDLGFANFNVNYDKVVPPEGVAFWAGHDSAFAVEAALRQNPDYRMRVADRVQREFVGQGAYGAATSLARWQRLRDALQPGLYAESARWGDYKPGGLRTVQEHWLPRVNGPAAQAWYAGRTAAVLGHLRSAGLYPALDPPLLSHPGGAVPAGFAIALTQTAPGGVIQFTLDGSDPRQPGGAVSSAARIYAQPIAVSSPTWLRARVRQNTTWSAVVEAQYHPPQDLGALQPSEIMYNPPKFGDVDGDEIEFLELHNSGTTELDLTGLSFRRGIDFAFSNRTVLGPGQHFVLARNAAQFNTRYPGVPLHGVYSGKLDNSGETLELSAPAAAGAAIFSFKYLTTAPWPAEADNSGLSLQRLNYRGHPTNALAWAAAPPTPGAAPPDSFTDLDGDGLSDGWESAHNLSDPDDDADGDGLTNGEEFRAGTHPRDEDDALRLKILPPSEPGMVSIALGFLARSNRTYSIAYSDGTANDAASWTNLEHFRAHPTNRPITFQHLVSATNLSRFFRLATPRLP